MTHPLWVIREDRTMSRVKQIGETGGPILVAVFIAARLFSAVLVMLHSREGTNSSPQDRTDHRSFSSNQTWETWTSLNPLKKTKHTNSQGFDSQCSGCPQSEWLQQDLVLTHLESFLSRQPIVTRKSLEHIKTSQITWRLWWVFRLNTTKQQIQFYLCDANSQQEFSTGWVEVWFTNLSPQPSK